MAAVESLDGLILLLHRIPRSDSVFDAILVTIIDLAMLVDGTVAVRVAERVRRLVLGKRATSLAFLVGQQEATICVAVVGGCFVVD